MARSRRSTPAVSFALVLLVGGCANENSPQNLGNRLQAELRPELANGSATLERLPDGARVTLPDQTLFPAGGAELDARGRFVLASLVEALLAPALLEVDIAGSAPTSLQQAKAGTVARFLRDIQVAPNLLFASVQEATPVAGTAPQATTITVTLPERSSRTDHPT